MAFGLPTTTPQYDYKGVQDCVDILHHEVEQYMQNGCLGDQYILLSMDERSFLEYVDGQDDRMRKEWEAYDYASNLLLIKIWISLEHEVARGAVETAFERWSATNPRIPLRKIRAARVRGPSREKRPDASWAPRNLPAHRSLTWPTMVLEVAWNESPPKIQQDMDFWLSDSAGQVKVALACLVRRSRIIIERWEMKTTRGIQAACPTQKMEIVRNAAPKCPRIQGKLEIAFEDIFLWEKRENETDFTLTQLALEEIGETVWSLDSPYEPIA